MKYSSTIHEPVMEYFMNISWTIHEQVMAIHEQFMKSWISFNRGLSSYFNKMVGYWCFQFFSIFGGSLFLCLETGLPEMT